MLARAARKRGIATLLALAYFVSFFAAPLASALNPDPLARMLAAQTWCLSDPDAAGGPASPSHGGDGPSGGQHAGSKHCPLCGTHHPPLIVPEAQIAWMPQAHLREGLPALFEQAPRVSHVWRAARSRAPPSLS